MFISPYFYSSFRDSTYTDTADGFSDGRDANGIEQIFEGINRDLVSLANSGHLADSEGDNGDAEQDDEVRDFGPDIYINNSKCRIRLGMSDSMRRHRIFHHLSVLRLWVGEC